MSRGALSDIDSLAQQPLPKVVKNRVVGTADRRTPIALRCSGEQSLRCVEKFIPVHCTLTTSRLTGNKPERRHLADAGRVRRNSFGAACPTPIEGTTQGGPPEK